MCINVIMFCHGVYLHSNCDWVLFTEASTVWVLLPGNESQELRGKYNSAVQLNKRKWVQPVLVDTSMSAYMLRDIGWFYQPKEKQSLPVWSLASEVPCTTPIVLQIYHNVDLCLLKSRIGRCMEAWQPPRARSWPGLSEFAPAKFLKKWYEAISEAEVGVFWHLGWVDLELDSTQRG